jgi:hypothetical protein
MVVKAPIIIGPADHGRQMSLNDFDFAEVQDGHLYELGRGVIVVSDVPGRKHFAQFGPTRDQFVGHKLSHPGEIHAILGGGECKILVAGFESERHPDLSVYLSAPPADDEDLWSRWIPAIVVEIVSLGSELRDYVEKRDEYLAFGVQEYWIIDAAKQEMLVLQRFKGQWREVPVKRPATYESKLLPGFVFATETIFQAADAIVG